MRRVLATLAIAGILGAFAGSPQASAARVEALELTPVHMAYCMRTGERVSDMNKICYYDCAGSEASQTVSATALCPLSMQSRGGGGTQPAGRQQRPMAAGCIKTGERTSGMNKTCSYSCAGSAREMTVGSAQLCPLNPR